MARPGIGTIHRTNEEEKVKILITGASSLPGFRTTLESLERNHEVVALHWRNPIPIEEEKLKKISMDISDLNSLREVVANERPDVLVHMAALGDVDLCEKDRQLAWETTVNPSLTLAFMASKIKAFTVYLSTDYVFDGETGGYKELDAPCPVNYYGLTKLLGEATFRSASIDCAIVRASSIYGFGPGRMNFAKFVIEKLERGEQVKALVDQYTSPTQATLLSKAVLEIIERRLTGIFHVVGERMSRFEFALRISERLGLDKRLISEARMSDMKWFARRPKDSSLDSTFTRSILKTDFYSTETALDILCREKEEAGRGQG
ncbi:MAG: SDR family oxidoreductase [Candidatus Bathyarchaeota archaeon]|nr:SDR family oxidoreductase [Candidatus Bathyarchaeota archaeon]